MVKKVKDWLRFSDKLNELDQKAYLGPEGGFKQKVSIIKNIVWKRYVEGVLRIDLFRAF